jgi:hypothetical protein
MSSRNQIPRYYVTRINPDGTRDDGVCGACALTEPIIQKMDEIAKKEGIGYRYEKGEFARYE